MAKVPRQMVHEYVIVHPVMGVYLGTGMGFGFFSLLDSVGQEYACTFSTREQARAHIESWDTNNNPEDYDIVQVFCPKGWASPEHMHAAGIPIHMLEPLYTNRELNKNDGWAPIH